jgi:hypothetical protein
MKELLELKKSKQSTITVNPALNKYDHKKDPVAIKKLQNAEETLAKCGFPEIVANQSAEKGEKLNFWTSGILTHADAKENTFSLTVATQDKLSENTYIISTSSETLAKTVKQFWGENIRVFLRPKAIIGQPFYYDLIEIAEK